ncbi:hypothetical protein WJX81_001917 [Elliptochloris bilobata]|uniref:Serine/threonine-protein phosphatase 2A regulatory subunit B'' subunit gamma n=1 Tax=Elliptochloris bilobata TaxID=381761 RepID=A0AAW1R9S5_9CHLO
MAGDNESRSAEQAARMLESGTGHDSARELEAIPHFFIARASPDSLPGIVQRAARLRLLQARSCELLDNAQLELVYSILQQCAGKGRGGADRDSEDGAEERLDYDEFCRAAAVCREAVGAYVDRHFRASLFLRFARDARGAIPLLSFFHYLMRRNALLQTRLHLSCFDEDGAAPGGAAGGEETAGGCAEGQDALLCEYAAFAARKLMFLHARRGRARVRDLLTSPALSELLELRMPPRDSSLPGSWFTPASMWRARALFDELDRRGCGCLSAEDFLGFSAGTMTPLFVMRLFEERAAAPGSATPQSAPAGGAWQGRVIGPRNPAIGGCCGMRWEAFLDFLLAWEHRGSAAGVRYFFPLFDLRGRGYITQVEVCTFFRAVHALWVAAGQYPELSVEDVKDELFDIVRPAHPLRITAADLLASSMAGTVIGLLADVNSFYAYDSRESLAAQADQGASGWAGALSSDM